MRFLLHGLDRLLRAPFSQRRSFRLGMIPDTEIRPGSSLGLFSPDRDDEEDLPPPLRECVCVWAPLAEQGELFFVLLPSTSTRS